MMYDWQYNDWPNFRYDISTLEPQLLDFRERAGHVRGLIEGLPEDIQTDTIIDLMISEAIKTSEIEGEFLSRADVMSSIRNQLGMNRIDETVKDRSSKGAGELMVKLRESWDEPLNNTALFDWHETLLQGSHRVKLGAWRTHTEPMQVVSGAIGKEKVHFEAVPSESVPKEMDQFIRWFNDSRSAIIHAPIRSGIAHLYFESIHPFEDGNGRMGRAISEKAIAQGLNRPVLLSLSQTIERNKKDYYTALERGQRSNDVNEWLSYFVQLCLDAQIEAEERIVFTLKKARFFDEWQDKLNDRQMRAIRKMLDAGVDGFEGGMNVRKYIAITKTSKATATRDMQHLSDLGLFIPQGGGRSTRYLLNI